MNSSSAVATIRDGHETVAVRLMLPTALVEHLRLAAEGRGQSMDEMLSERVIEFRDLYGLI